MTDVVPDTIANAKGEAAVEPEVRALWERYRDNGDEDVREKLILHYAPVVKYVAGRVGAGMSSSIEHGDLVSYGMFGLIDAIERFDLDREVKFETYAITRIRGAIIDELRAVDWVPRSVRTKARNLAKAIQHLHGELKRTPTDEELAAHLRISVPDLREMLEQVQLTSIAALDDVLMSGGDGLTLMDTIEDTSVAGPEERADESALRGELARSIEELSDRERQVVALYYFEGLTLAQVGDILGVTESRICQIHAKAVLSLRSDLLERLRG